MAIKWTRLSDQRQAQNNGGTMFVLNRRLHTDASKTLVLEDGDPRAAFIIGGEGSSFSEEEARAYGLDDTHRLKEEPIVEVDGVPDGELPDGWTPIESTFKLSFEEGGESEELVDFEAMTKAKLLEFAEDHGVEVKSSWNKAQIIEALQAG